MKYILIIILLSGFVIMYIWQNIEVMKIKMHHRKQVAVESTLQKEIDIVTYKIERLKNIHALTAHAKNNNLKKIRPQDIITLDD